MFGVIPKKIWGRLVPVDDNNLVPMETNLFVLKTGRTNLLLDTGFGDCLTDSEKKIYGITGETEMENGLKTSGISDDEIDIVFLSHLHTDHAGGAVIKSDHGMKPRFPKARHIVQKREWNDAMHPNERTTAVYIPERLRILEESGQLELIDGEKEIFPGVKAIPTGGHTPGHQAIEMSSGGKTVVYYADIVPSSLHMRIPYVAAVDLDPTRTMEVKRKLVEYLLEGDKAIVFDHDTIMKIGQLRQTDGKIIVDKIE